MPRMKKKSELPSKMCPVCKLRFTWRARWRRNWEEVVYCSRRCAGNRSRAQELTPDT